MKMGAGWLGAFLVLVSAVTVVVAVRMIGSPTYQRELRMDEKRLRDLAGIVGAIDDNWKAKNEFPSSLAELDAANGGGLELKDPESKEPYQFVKKEPKAFQVCAKFSHPSDGPSRIYMHSDRHPSWEHGEGVACFDFQMPK